MTPSMKDQETNIRSQTPSLASTIRQNLNIYSAIYCILFILFVSMVSGAFIYLGSIGWPGLHWDSALYGTPVINVANGKGWKFGSHGLAILNDPNRSFNFHGILHVFVYGVIFNLLHGQNICFFRESLMH